ncbi:MAG: methyl-accepting chemotaxis protein [Natronospirillum sp.]
MTVKLSFNQKMLFMIILTMVGFIGVALVATGALRQMNNTSRVVDQLTNQQDTLNALQVDLLLAANALSPSANPNQLAALPERHLLVLQPGGAAGLADNTMADGLQQWVNTMTKWLNLHAERGINRESGVRGQAQAAVETLRGQMFSMFNNVFQSLRAHLDALNDDPSPENFAAADAALTAFEQSAEDYDFMELYGPTLATLRQAMEAIGHLDVQIAEHDLQARTQQSALLAQVNDQLAELDNRLTSARSAALNASERAERLILSASISIALVVVVVLWLMQRRVSRTLNSTVVTLNRIAQGDLSQRLMVNTGRQDEFDKVGEAVNRVTQDLSTALTEVQRGSAELQQGATALRSTLHELVVSNDEASRQTQSVAGSVQEIASTVHQMAEETTQAHHQASDASSAAESGHHSVQQAMTAIESVHDIFGTLNQNAAELEKASERVDSVTDMINNLAEQTNMLALNAAIEAARAGEAGRGFSVVADEVRGLVEKTVRATSNINGIVGDMQDQMHRLLDSITAGSAQVTQGKSMSERAAEEIHQVKALVDDVASRNHILATSIEEIAQTTVVINDSMTQVTALAQVSNDKLHAVEGFSEQVAAQTEQQRTVTQRFRCT